MGQNGDADDDLTPIQLPREFLVHCYRNLGKALEAAASICVRNADVVEAGGGTDDELAGFEDDLNDLASLAAGSGRATRRFRLINKEKP